jgi:hypothetical protein
MTKAKKSSAWNDYPEIFDLHADGDIPYFVSGSEGREGTGPVFPGAKIEFQDT